MITKVAYSAVPVSDIIKARDFYEGLLGLKLKQNFQDKWLEYDVSGATFVIAATIEPSNPNKKRITSIVTTIVFEADDLDGFVSKLEERKIDFVIVPSLTGSLILIKDPDGNSIGIHKHS